MKRAILTASLMLVFFVGAVNANTEPIQKITHHRLVIRMGLPCKKTFTVKMAKRAARYVYRHARTITRSDLEMLTRIRRCLRSPHSRPYVSDFYKHQKQLHAKRVIAVKMSQPQGYWLASWYYDGGSTASGFHSYYGIAMCGSAGPCYSFGTKIELFYGGRSVIAVVDDHGPYAGGRNIDLNQNVAHALGFGGVGTVGYRVIGG